MNFHEFEESVQRIRAQKPMWFSSQNEKVATDEQLVSAEKILGVELPSEYKEFVRRYGGGYFALTNVFSVDPASEWYIVVKQKEFNLSDKFVAITDDETGGAYGFLVESRKCSDAVFYLNPDENGIAVLQYASFLEYLAKVGLSA